MANPAMSPAKFDRRPLKSIRKAIIGYIDKVVSPLSKCLHWLGATLLFGMMLLTTADVILRYFFNRPITGSFELTQYLMVMIVSLLLPSEPPMTGWSE